LCTLHFCLYTRRACRWKVSQCQCKHTSLPEVTDKEFTISDLSWHKWCTIYSSFSLQGNRAWEGRGSNTERKTLHNLDLHICIPPNVNDTIWDETSRACISQHMIINEFKILVGKLKRKWQLGRPRRRSKDNIKMCHKETGCKSVDSSQLAQDTEQWRVLMSRVLWFCTTRVFFG
jgi:hypothetical protein